MTDDDIRELPPRRVYDVLLREGCAPRKSRLTTVLTLLSPSRRHALDVPGSPRAKRYPLLVRHAVEVVAEETGQSEAALWAAMRGGEP